MESLRPEGAATTTPVSSVGTIALAEGVIGPLATAWAVQVAARVSAAVEREARTPGSGLPLTGLERQACEACLLIVLSQLRAPGLPIAAPPGEAVEQVRLAVRQGAAIDGVLRLVWACHAGVQDALLEMVTQEPPPDLTTEVRRVTGQLLTFADALVRTLSQCFDEERSAWHDRLASQRRQLVDELLESGRTPAGADHVLGLRVNNHHLGASLWPTTPNRPQGWQRETARFIDQVTRTLGADSAVVIDRPDGSIEVIWTSAVPLDAGTDLVEQTGLLRRLGVALGPPGAGVSGLRDSVLGARQTARVGQLTDAPGVWAYGEAGLLALLTADADAAGRYVRHVLGGLTGEDAKSAAIRQTLHRYLEHGRSRVAAAEDLHLAANTVAYRVRQAEEYLGRPVGVATVETLIALRVAAQFPHLLR